MTLLTLLDRWHFCLFWISSVFSHFCLNLLTCYHFQHFFTLWTLVTRLALMSFHIFDLCPFLTVLMSLNGITLLSLRFDWVHNYFVFRFFLWFVCFHWLIWFSLLFNSSKSFNVNEVKKMTLKKTCISWLKPGIKFELRLSQ